MAEGAQVMETGSWWKQGDRHRGVQVCAVWQDGEMLSLKKLGCCTWQQLRSGENMEDSVHLTAPYHGVHAVSDGVVHWPVPNSGRERGLNSVEARVRLTVLGGERADRRTAPCRAPAGLGCARYWRIVGLRQPSIYATVPPHCQLHNDRAATSPKQRGDERQQRRRGPSPLHRKHCGGLRRRETAGRSRSGRHLNTLCTAGIPHHLARYQDYLTTSLPHTLPLSSSSPHPSCSLFVPRVVPEMSARNQSSTSVEVPQRFSTTDCAFVLIDHQVGSALSAPPTGLTPSLPLLRTDLSLSHRPPVAYAVRQRGSAVWM